MQLPYRGGAGIRLWEMPEPSAEGHAGMTGSTGQSLPVAQQSHMVCAGPLPPAWSRSIQEGSEEGRSLLISPLSAMQTRRETAAWSALH